MILTKSKQIKKEKKNIIFSRCNEFC